MIPFNKPSIVGNELEYIQDAVKRGKISGDGYYTNLCSDFFREKFSFSNPLLTTSCTSALEMTALLMDIKEGDEIIAPSYTFVSTVNAYILQGAKVVFIDSMENDPNMDISLIEKLITPKTKAIIAVHYAGISVDMDYLVELCKKHNLYLVEDCAQAIDSFYKGKRLGTFGQFSAFSFHETKNIICGEGGLLVVNDDKFADRAEIIREKGTNRSLFFRGEIDKYGWVDKGSSYLPSDLLAAYLFAQLENIDKIQSKRKYLWNLYYGELKELYDLKYIQLPIIPEDNVNNAHMFYIVLPDLQTRTNLIKYLKEKGIYAVFHYQSLHRSEYMVKNNFSEEVLINSDRFSDCLLRLPLFYELTEEDVLYIAKEIKLFFNGKI